MTRRRISPRRQGGFALVAAIFLIVVLATLGIMMVTVGGSQRATVSAAAQGARAYHAARSGVEWGAFRATVDGSCAATSTIPMTASGLTGFTVTVQCGATQHRESGNTYNVFVITATAASGAYGGSDYASRRVTVTVTDAPP